MWSVDALCAYSRMEQMQKRLPEIMLQKADTDGDQDENGELGEDEDEANAGAEDSDHDLDRNEDGEV